MRRNMSGNLGLYKYLWPGSVHFKSGVFNLLYHATPLTDFGILATPHNDNVKIELPRLKFENVDGYM